MAIGKVYLIPTVLQEDDQAFEVLPPYILDRIKLCDIFFAENIKTTRRYFKRWWKEMVIDQYDWYAIHKMEEATIETFKKSLQEGKNVGIISEAGCPGVADPGQRLIDAAQGLGAIVHPLVGPSSILLALMASGMNGQKFKFCGYLPIDKTERRKMIGSLEEESKVQQCTQIFIETPYRNNALIADIIGVCHPDTRLCIAVDITSKQEIIQTRPLHFWKTHMPDFHKRPAIFLLLGS